MRSRIGRAGCSLIAVSILAGGYAGQCGEAPSLSSLTNNLLPAIPDQTIVLGATETAPETNEPSSETQSTSGTPDIPASRLSV